MAQSDAKNGGKTAEKNSENGAKNGANSCEKTAATAGAKVGNFSLWCDYIERDFLLGGEFDALVSSGAIGGVTTNPAIFKAALARPAYAAQKAHFAEKSEKKLYEILAATDIKIAAQKLLPQFAKFEFDKGVAAKMAEKTACEMAKNGGQEDENLAKNSENFAQNAGENGEKICQNSAAATTQNVGKNAPAATQNHAQNQPQNPAQTPARNANGFVSFEVSPALSDDAEATFAEAKRLYANVKMPNVMVKIPATREGLKAARRLVARGVSVNATLVFSARQTRECIEAFAQGTAKFRRRFPHCRPPECVISVFVSRFDRALNAQLAAAGLPQNKYGIYNAAFCYHLVEGARVRGVWVQGAATLVGGAGEGGGKNAAIGECGGATNSNLASGADKNCNADDEKNGDFDAHTGGEIIRCDNIRALFASTSVASVNALNVELGGEQLPADYYIRELYFANAINTAPLPEIRAFVAGGGLANAPKTPPCELELDRFFVAADRAGIDYFKVCETLLADGLKSFNKAFDEILKNVKK